MQFHCFICWYLARYEVSFGYQILDLNGANSLEYERLKCDVIDLKKNSAYQNASHLPLASFLLYPPKIFITFIIKNIF